MYTCTRAAMRRVIRLPAASVRARSAPLASVMRQASSGNSWFGVTASPTLAFRGPSHGEYARAFATAAGTSVWCRGEEAAATACGAVRVRHSLCVNGRNYGPGFVFRAGFVDAHCFSLHGTPDVQPVSTRPRCVAMGWHAGLCSLTNG